MRKADVFGHIFHDNRASGYELGFVFGNGEANAAELVLQSVAGVDNLVGHSQLGGACA